MRCINLLGRAYLRTSLQSHDNNQRTQKNFSVANLEERYEKIEDHGELSPQSSVYIAHWDFLLKDFKLSEEARWERGRKGFIGVTICISVEKKYRESGFLKQPASSWKRHALFGVWLSRYLGLFDLQFTEKENAEPLIKLLTNPYQIVSPFLNFLRKIDWLQFLRRSNMAVDSPKQVRWLSVSHWSLGSSFSRYVLKFTCLIECVPVTIGLNRL